MSDNHSPAAPDRDPTDATRSNDPRRSAHLPHRSGWPLAGAIVAGSVGGAAAVLWAWCAFLVVSSRFATDPADDPHGYALIFGTLLGLAAAAVTALVLPSAFPRHRRAQVATLLVPASLITSILLLAALFTA